MASDRLESYETLSPRQQKEALSTGPDFVCIGMPKAGTGWLFDQLRFHPDFWMPPVKEIDYLHRPFPALKHANKLLSRVSRSADRGRTDKAMDGTELAFVTEAVALTGQKMDVGRYAQLFRHKGHLISGDISPDYSSMNSDQIEQVAKHLPHLRIILLVRDPVSRAWSHISLLH